MLLGYVNFTSVIKKRFQEALKNEEGEKKRSLKEEETERAQHFRRTA